jgi:hypothetical protein
MPKSRRLMPTFWVSRLHSYIQRRYLNVRGFTLSNYTGIRLISGFRRDVDEICALLGYYAALSGCSVPDVSG